MVTVSLHGNFTFTEVAWIDGTLMRSQKTGDHLANWGGLLPLREENEMQRLELVAAGRRRLVQHHLVRLRQPLVGHDPCALLPQLLVLQDEAPTGYWEVAGKVVLGDLTLFAVKCPQVEDKLEAVGSAALVLLQAGGLVEGGEEGEELLGEWGGGEGGGQVARWRSLAEAGRWGDCSTWSWTAHLCLALHLAHQPLLLLLLLRERRPHLLALLLPLALVDHRSLS